MTTTSTNFEEIRNSIRTIFAKGNEEIRKDATPYGFEGLELTPIIDFGTDGDGNHMTAKVTTNLLNLWNITESEVIEIGLNNITYNISDFFGMVIVSNNTMFKGASSVIPATKELIKRYPNGYVVLPSSIHEVIIVPKDNETNVEELNEMVRQINAGVVAEEDKLSDDIYEFVA